MVDGVSREAWSPEQRFYEGAREEQEAVKAARERERRAGRRCCGHRAAAHLRPRSPSIRSSLFLLRLDSFFSVPTFSPFRLFFLCDSFGYFGGNRKTELRNRHRICRLLILQTTDRLLMSENRNLQIPNKPNRFVGFNRMPRLSVEEVIHGSIAVLFFSPRLGFGAAVCAGPWLHAAAWDNESSLWM